MARCQLPFSFNVMLKPQGPRFPAKHETRKRVQLEQTGGAPPAPEPRLVQPKVVAQRNPPANINEYINHPAPGIDHHDTSIGAQTNEGNPSISPSLLLSLGPPRNADPSCSAAPIEVFDQAITPPITDEQRFPTLREVNPESRSITGGARVWLKGVDFPAHFPLYARFGTAVVLTVSQVYLPYGPYLIGPDILHRPSSYLLFAACNHARCCRCYAFKTSPVTCAGVWDQCRKISVHKRPGPIVGFLICTPCHMLM